MGTTLATYTGGNRYVPIGYDSRNYEQKLLQLGKLARLASTFATRCTLQQRPNWFVEYST